MEKVSNYSKKNNKVKILFFIESLGSGGKERRLVELIKGLSNDVNIELELVLTKKAIHYKDIYSTGIKIHFTIRKHFKKDPSVFFKFYKIANTFRPDIIHVWGNMVAIYAIPTKLLLRIPLINNQITSAPLNVSTSLLGHKLPFYFSDKIIANTYAGLKSFSAPKHKSLVIYNGFDFDRINNLQDKSSIIKKFNIQTKFIVGMVASFTDKKDYDTYIKAANIVLEKENDITFLCIGSGNYSPFEMMVKKENKDRILFLGKQDNVESIMNICDIGILITNNEKHGEGISNALLEFSALSKPLIATLGGGNSEIVEHEKSGYLINPKSPDELALKILHLYNHENDLRNFGEMSIEVVREKFSISKMIEEFRSVYNKTLV